MPFLAKVGSVLKSCVSASADFAGEQTMKLLKSQYPDINDVIVVLDQVKDRVKNDDVDTIGNEDGASNIDDGKWRPNVLIMAILYKYQLIQDHVEEGGWFNSKDVFVKDADLQNRMLNVFGMYWHIIVKVSNALKSFQQNVEIEEDVHQQLCHHVGQAIEFEEKNVLFAHQTDSENVDAGHCPDFAVILVHHHRQILVNICGTRMIPTPHMSDVFMDLMADSTEFLTGKAHRGMALGSNNIYERCKDAIIKAVSENEGYGILITGYSLGAGVCQLLAMDLMEKQQAGGDIPTEISIRCLSFGAPPVYECPNGTTHPNLFSVVNNHDGLASASLDSVTKLFEQVKAVKELNLGRREMFKMLTQPIPSASHEGKCLNEKPGDDGNDSDGESDIVDFDASMPENWKKVRAAVESVEKEDSMGMSKLTHPAGNVLVFKRNPKKGQLVLRRFIGPNVQNFSRNLRLKGAMFNHHMPWGYNGLFDGHGIVPGEVSLEDFEDIMKVYYGNQESANSLYPNLQDV